MRNSLIENINKCMFISDNEELERLFDEYMRLNRITFDSWSWLFKTARYHNAKKQLPVITEEFRTLVRTITNSEHWVVRNVKGFGHVIFWSE